MTSTSRDDGSQPARVPAGTSLSRLIASSPVACSVAVIRGGEVAVADGSVPVGTMFQAGSISKPVAAVVALEMAARGQADLDADVNDLLTSWQLPGANGITLRHLLGHTAGIGVPFLPGYRPGMPAPTLLQSLDGSPPATTAPVWSDRALKDNFRYSGGGYAVLQQLVTDRANQPFAKTAKELVLEPIGMADSTFEQPLPARLHASAARPDWNTYPEAAAAGLWTTPADLARFVCALQGGHACLPSALHHAIAAQMLTPHGSLPARGQWMALPLFGLRPPDSAGLGMFLTGDAWFSHIGGARSFCSMLTGSIADGAGAVVMTATGSPRLVFRLMRAISDQEGWRRFRMRGRERVRSLPKSLRSLF
jgi:CubicO group peptidase (beta-lactamase class C family)